LALPDSLPAPRYRIVERGGRLEVIDSLTGERPLSAAERMVAHDAAHGHAAMRYDRIAETAEAVTTAPVSAPAIAPVPALKPQSATAPIAADTIRPALAQRANPWGGNNGGRTQLGAQSQSEAQARPSPSTRTAPARPAPHANAARDSKRQPIVTGQWWDAKGPRTIDLGAAGRAKLSNGFGTALIIAFFVIIVLIIVEPALLLIAGFVLFRFGGKIVGPIGAGVIDAAIKADGGR